MPSSPDARWHVGRSGSPRSSPPSPSPAAPRVGYVAAGGERATLDWDQLVLACGSAVNVNLVPGAAAYAYPLKTLGDAIALGNDLIARLEEASAAVDPRVRQHLLSVVVM